MSEGKLRRHDRTEVRAIVQIMWKDRSGNDKFTNAHTIDVSESGMRIEVPEPLPERSYVTMRVDKLTLQGTASVRSCVRKGTKYVAGLEFSNGMKFTPKPSKTEVEVKEAPPAAAESVPQIETAAANQETTLP